MTCSMIQINLFFFFFLSTLNYNLQLSNSQKVNNVQHYNKRSTKQINYRNTWLCICSEIRSLMLKVGNLTKKSQLFLSLKKKIPPFFFWYRPKLRDWNLRLILNYQKLQMLSFITYIASK